MKKLLLGTAAVALGMSFVASQASAQVSLDVGGHTKLYGSWVDQDDADTTATVDETRNLDILRETELHFTGETTLDNGLTVGAHFEVDVDGTDSSFATQDAEEAYAYFTGAWGRVNFGREDGAAYLLQVAAPSADSNTDGIRQWVSGTNYTTFAAAAGVDLIALDTLFDATNGTGFNSAALNNQVIHDADGDNAISNTVDTLINWAGFNGTGAPTTLNTRFDYDQAISGYSDKLTYMTPVFNGFQAGVSYTPDVGNSRDLGNTTADGQNDFGSVWDVAARYEGQFDEVGVTFGGGWSHADREGTASVLFYRSVDGTAGYNAGADPIVGQTDDREVWNVGLDLNWKAFGLGGAFMRDDNGVSGDAWETDTWVVGIDYTTGPFKLGASYYDASTDIGDAEVDVDRWSGGVVYTYGPGMTFRGSVSFINHDEDLGYTSTDADSTNVLLGTQINF